MQMTINPAARCFKDLKGREGFQLILGEYVRRVSGEPSAFTEADMDKIVAAVYRDRHEQAIYLNWWRAFHMIHHLSAEARRLAMEALWQLTVITGWLSVQAYHTKDDEEFCGKISEMWWAAECVERVLADYARIRALVEAFSNIHGVEMLRFLGREETMLAKGLAEYCKLVEILDAALTKTPLAVGEKKLVSSHFFSLSLIPADLPSNLTSHLMATIEANYDADKLWSILLGAFDKPLKLV